MPEQAPWVWASDGSRYERPFGVFCEHCGSFLGISQPVAVSVYLAASRAFTELHASCTEPQPGAAERLDSECLAVRRGRF